VSDVPSVALGVPCTNHEWNTDNRDFHTNVALGCCCGRVSRVDTSQHPSTFTSTRYSSLISVISFGLSVETVFDISLMTADPYCHAQNEQRSSCHRRSPPPVTIEAIGKCGCQCFSTEIVTSSAHVDCPVNAIFPIGWTVGQSSDGIPLFRRSSAQN
jgi:hypothetical protein